MSYRGDFRAGDTIDLKFQTLNVSAVPTTLAGTPAISVYKSNSTTESAAGITLTVDFDTRTGMHHVRIATASDGTFYAEQNDFDVVITAGTVNSVSVVGRVVASFSLANRSALRPATAGRQAVVNSDGTVQSDMQEILSTAVSTPATAGILDVNLKNIANAAVDTTAAQLGVKVVSSANVDFTAAQKTSLNASTPASIQGAVATVTSPVSVTGDFSATMKTSLNSSTPTVSAVTLSGDLTSTMKTSIATIVGTAQTGDSYARIGAAGASLTALGDTRIANLDATVSSRLAPAGTLATVTTVTNVTNAPTSGDLTSTMKASVTAAVPAASAIAAAVSTHQPASETYATDGAIPTLEQLLLMIWSTISQFGVSGTTITCKKLDGSTTSMTFSTDSATAPTERTRAS